MGSDSGVPELDDQTDGRRVGVLCVWPRMSERTVDSGSTTGRVAAQNTKRRFVSSKRVPGPGTGSIRVSGTSSSVSPHREHRLSVNPLTERNYVQDPSPCPLYSCFQTKGVFVWDSVPEVTCH